MSVLLTYRNSGQRLWDAQDTILMESDFLSDGIANFNGDKTDLKVIQNSPQAMSVLVGIGRAYKSVTVSGVERKERIYNTAQATVAIASNGGGSNRIDAIIARWKVDVEPDGEADNASTIERVAGSGVSALTDGAIQSAIGSDKFERLADIRVQPAATQIFTADITDTRVFCRTKNIHLGLTQNFSLKGESMNDGSLIELLKMVYSGSDFPEWQTWPRITSGLGTTPPADAALATKKYVDDSIGAVGSLTGSVQMWTMKTAPAGWLLCYGQAVSRSTYSGLFAAMVPSLGNPTVTIASPAVFTLTAHGLTAGDAVFLTTTGALPTGFTANTLYYVIATGIDADHFRLSATRGGSVINSSGSQSGTHTIRHCPYGLGDGSTTFNIPDFRSRSPFGHDLMGGGSATSRTTGVTLTGLGESAAGEEKHQITLAEMASHNHASSPLARRDLSGGASGLNFANTTAVGTNEWFTASVGSDTAHNNMPPYLGINFIIKT